MTEAKPVKKTYNNDELTKIYLKMRDAKSAARKEWEAKEAEFDKKMEAIENILLKTLIGSKAKSMATDSGNTFYREEVVKPSCGDWPTFYKWIAENDCFEALEKRVTKTFITDYLKVHETLPPGIAIAREYVVRVRRGSNN